MLGLQHWQGDFSMERNTGWKPISAFSRAPQRMLEDGDPRGTPKSHPDDPIPALWTCLADNLIHKLEEGEQGSRPWTRP